MKNKDYKNRIAHLIARIDEKIKQYLVIELQKSNIKDLYPSHGDIIGTLLIKNHLSMKELAKEIGRNKSTVTGLTDKLIRLGYIRKTKDPNDNRISIISLTDKGEALTDRWLEISKELRKTVTYRFTESEKEELVYLLTKIDSNFSK